jgi:hypothetical protein
MNLELRQKQRFVPVIHTLQLFGDAVHPRGQQPYHPQEFLHNAQDAKAQNLISQRSIANCIG